MLPYKKTRPVSEYREHPFSRAMGSNTGEGTYGCLEILFDQRGTLYMQVYNAEEAAWWKDFFTGHAEVIRVNLVPAADQEETNLPFSAPENIDYHDMIID